MDQRSHPRSSGEATRRRLIDAARECFARTGYHGTSTAEIAATAGCSEATLFKHYRAKQALLAAVIRDAGSWIESLAVPAGRQEDPAAALRAHLRGFLADPRFADMTRVRSFAVALVDEEEIRTALIETRARIRPAITGIAEAAQAAGRFRADVPADHIYEMVLGLSFAASFDQSLDGDVARDRLLAVADSIIRLVSIPEGNVPDDAP